MTIRWGLIGVGDIANKRVAAAIQSDVNSELVAVCRRDGVKLAAFAAQYGVHEKFLTAEKLVRCTDVDAVYIATPVDCHCPQTLLAAAAGKHVLVEKPMALNPSESKQMISACLSARVHLGVAYYRRFYPVVRRIKELIESDQLGNVLTIACVTGNPNRFPADDWRVALSRGGGGPLMDIGSHRIDVMMQLLGEVDQVQASVVPSPNYEAEQAATVTMRFISGPQGVLQCYFGTSNTPDRLEVVGTLGRVTVEDLNTGELSLYTCSGHQHESHPPADNFHTPLIRDFTSAINDGRPPEVSGPAGMRTDELIHMAYTDAGIR